ncbi:MAG: metal-dependent hydrolase, partial [Bacteroidota bacterium]
MGEAVLGKKVGNRAPLWGAIAGTIPDLDVVATPFLSTVDGALFHRGFSHSMLFAVLLAPLLGWLIHRIYRQRKGSWRGWAWLSFWALVTHPLLDCFTNWGTQLFWPHASRLSWNTIFVIDPLYTLPFLFFLVWALRKPRQHPLRQRLNHVGIIISSLYLLVTVVNKQIVNGVFLDSLNRELISVEQYQTMPTPLNNILWTVVAESEEEFYIGYYSLINSPTTISYRAFP